jgi:hypothetical protein
MDHHGAKANPLNSPGEPNAQYAGRHRTWVEKRVEGLTIPFSTMARNDGEKQEGKF